MFPKLISVVVFAVVLACVVRAQEPKSAEAKSIGDLLTDLTGDDREIADLALDELGKNGKGAISTLITLAERGKPQNRVRAITVLARLKDRSVSQVLIEILKDDDDWIRGASAYALSQVGGEDAKTALLLYLSECLKRDTNELRRATEAVMELPDERAIPLLLKVIEEKSKKADDQHFLEYPVRALGKLKSQAAAVPIAKLLDPNVSYQDSYDYYYLNALNEIGNRESAPYLIDYLIRLEKRIGSHEWFKGDENDPSFWSSMGAGNRQRESDRRNFGMAVKCLESITGKPSRGKLPIEILQFWKDQRELLTP